MKSHWQDVGRRISSLREAARTLYSFQNPFNDRIGISADESVVSLSPTRQADEQTRSIEVRQLARADRFLSRPLQADYEIPAGDYVFSVGKELIEFPYRGGTIKNFVDTINRRGTDRIKASLISVQAGSPSLLVESLRTGSKPPLAPRAKHSIWPLKPDCSTIDSREERPRSIRQPQPLPVPVFAVTILSEGVLYFTPGAQPVFPFKSP